LPAVPSWTSSSCAWPPCWRSSAPHTGYDAVVGRGGLLEPLPGGTYIIDDEVLADLRAARRGEHASNLGPFLAARVAAAVGCPAFLVDPVSVDEWEPVARYSGMAGVERESLSHALNTRAVARRHAAEHGTTYDALRLVVVHLGSGIRLGPRPRPHDRRVQLHGGGAVRHGPGRRRAVHEAAGPGLRRRLGLPPAAALRRRLFGDGGVFGYLGTRDLEVVLARIDGGDAEAARVVAAMLYQVSKEAGAMAAVLEGRVDAVLVTGGMAHAPRISDGLRQALQWIAPVHVYPGEDELQALAEGAQRVLDGDEPALRYGESRLRRP
jgi:butyrate kinase